MVLFQQPLVLDRRAGEIGTLDTLPHPLHLGFAFDALLRLPDDTADLLLGEQHIGIGVGRLIEHLHRFQALLAEIGGIAAAMPAKGEIRPHDETAQLHRLVVLLGSHEILHESFVGIAGIVSVEDRQPGVFGR